MAKAITDATFEAETKEGLVLVDFWATWCGPCRMQAPILEKLSEELSEDELKILKMDVDENPETARAFGIMSIPTFLFNKDVQVSYHIVSFKNTGLHVGQPCIGISGPPIRAQHLYILNRTQYQIDIPISFTHVYQSKRMKRQQM